MLGRSPTIHNSLASGLGSGAAMGILGGQLYPFHAPSLRMGEGREVTAPYMAGSHAWLRFPFWELSGSHPLSHGNQ